MSIQRGDAEQKHKSVLCRFFILIFGGENVEKVMDGPLTIEVYENDIMMFLQMFQEENQIDDLKKESQAVWNSCLRYIYKNVFKNKDFLKQKNNTYTSDSIIPSTFNSYNYDIVFQVLDIYIYDLCMRYDKEVSIIGFSSLTGIDESVIYDWGNNSTQLSSRSTEIYKKLHKFREESLSNKLATGKQNPVGVIAMLNRHYGWASPYTSDSNRQKSSLTAAELPKLGQNNDIYVNQIERKD